MSVLIRDPATKHVKSKSVLNPIGMDSARSPSYLDNDEYCMSHVGCSKHHTHYHRLHLCKGKAERCLSTLSESAKRDKASSHSEFDSDSSHKCN